MSWVYVSQSSGSQLPPHKVTTDFLSLRAENETETQHIPRDSATGLCGPTVASVHTPCLTLGQFIHRCSPKEGSVLRCVVAVRGRELDYIWN